MVSYRRIFEWVNDNCVTGIGGDNGGHYIKFVLWDKQATSNQHVAFEILIPSAHSCTLSNEHQVILGYTRALT